jgi:hypothetical protein
MMSAQNSLIRVAPKGPSPVRVTLLGVVVVLAGCGATSDGLGNSPSQSAVGATETSLQSMRGANQVAGAPSQVAVPSAQPVTATSPSPATGLANLPLIDQAGLKYVGAFRFPNLYTGNVCHGFTYGGRGLTFNPEGNGGAGSLYSVGHPSCSYVGEIDIPTPGTATTVEGLPMAQLLQPKGSDRIADVLEGALASSGIGGGTNTTVNGLLVHKGSLYLSAGNAYASTQPVTHWRRPLDLSSSGRVAGPATVSGSGQFSNPRFTAGYMCHVPPELQSALGAPALTGWVADSIVTGTSNGPSAFAFNPEGISGRVNVPAVPLLFYPSSSPLQESVAGQSQQLWNWTSIPRGCALPNGTRSLLFIGRHGAGKFEYGVGGVNGHTNDAARRPIYDPSDSSTGEHAWPYRYQVWAYDVMHLANVKQGKARPGSVRPYAVWTLNLPFEVAEDGHNLEGIAYDSKRAMLYLVQSEAAKFGESIVHVLHVERVN